MNSIKNVFFLCFCFFIPFENTQLSSFGGVLTASPSILFLVLGLICNFLSLERINIKIFILVFIVNVISFGYFFYWIFNFPILDYGFIFDRGIRFFVIVFLYFGAFLFSIRQSKGTIINGGKVISVVIFLSLLSHFLVPSLVYEVSFLHSSEYISTDRMRGFALESSTFGYQIICMVFILSIIYKINMLFTIILSCILSIISTSKGALSVLLLSLLIVFFIIKNIHIIHKLLLISIISVLTYVIVNGLLLTLFLNDIERYTSVATRLTVFLLGLKALIYYPLGTGYFGFLPFFYENGQDTILFIKEHLSVPLIFNEVESYFQLGAFESVGTKSTIIDLIVFFGWFFLIPFCIFIKKIFFVLLKKGDYKLLILFLFIILSNVFYLSSLTLYLTPFVVGFVINLSRNEEIV